MLIDERKKGRTQELIEKKKQEKRKKEKREKKKRLKIFFRILNR